jgi:hypothetical protein
MQRITNDLFESIRKVSAPAKEATPTILNEETVQEDYTKEADEIIAEMTEQDLAESLEEAKMDYSAKKARAGKDIGKPGKMFGKIAASAAKRYGSEERGKKVAGAVLAKLRAKSMKEEAEQTDEAMSPQAKTTMKHIKNPTPGEKKAAKDIKPGIAGYRDRVAMLKSAQARGGLKEEETITMEFVIENTIEVSVPSTVTYQDYINAIKTIVNSEDPAIQAEIVSIANEAFNNNNIEVIAEAELIKQGIIEANYKATRMGDKEYSPELNLDVDRTKPGVTKVSRRIRSGEGKGTTATERRTMKRIASRTK